ncbi:YkgJ family cysteine cluster protein [Patescibacteria group bacterium]|nr:YkgJ family cysteine cluster protein [Patescibacteria group bacterium]
MTIRAKSPHERHLLDDVLKSHHCMNCRLCCKYGPDDKVDAPLFTLEAKDRLLVDFPDRNIEFRQVGILWQIVLKRLEDELKERYICPVYDKKACQCEVYEYRPFDCVTWPFYIMRKDKRVLITLSFDCPVVMRANTSFLIELAKFKIGPFMIEQARIHPDLITEYHGHAKILLDVTDKLTNQNQTNAQKV